MKEFLQILPAYHIILIIIAAVLSVYLLFPLLNLLFGNIKKYFILTKYEKKNFAKSYKIKKDERQKNIKKEKNSLIDALSDNPINDKIFKKK